MAKASMEPMTIRVVVLAFTRTLLSGTARCDSSRVLRYGARALTRYGSLAAALAGFSARSDVRMHEVECVTRIFVSAFRHRWLACRSTRRRGQGAPVGLSPRL